MLFSGAFVIWGLALFFLLFDALPLKRLAFPLVVIGMNSILIYLFGELMGDWTVAQVHTHFGSFIRGVFGKSGSIRRCTVRSSKTPRSSSCSGSSPGGCTISGTSFAFE